MYYILDPKLVELGLMPSLDVGKTIYESQIRNGLQMQLRRVELGNDLEEAHMRNRQLIAAWAYEMGLEDKVIEKIEKDGKHYFVINDFEALRGIFAEQLREIQRIKSEGDYEAGKALVETWGVKVDRAMHEEVLARIEHGFHLAGGHLPLVPERVGCRQAPLVKRLPRTTTGLGLLCRRVRLVHRG